MCEVLGLAIILCGIVFQYVDEQLLGQGQGQRHQINYLEILKRASLAYFYLAGNRILYTTHPGEV